MLAVTNEQIEALALASGFQLKQQPDGSMALRMGCSGICSFLVGSIAKGVSPVLARWQPGPRRYQNDNF